MRQMAVVVVLMLLAVAVCAEDYVEVEIDGMGETNIVLNLDTDFGNGFGAFAFLQDSRGWSQFYAGPTWAPCDEVQIGVGLGLETDSHEVRKGGFVWVGESRLSLLSLFEDGGSGFWQYHRLEYRLGGDWSAGMMDRTGYGKGIVVTRTLGSNDNIRVEGYRQTLAAVWHHSF